MRRLTLLLTLFVAVSAFSQDAQYQESIDVVRILFDVRVTEYGGDPILGLDADDFIVTIGGKRTSVESVRWVDETTGIVISAEGVSTPNTEDVVVEEKRGRLIVIFIQTDFAREKPRMAGQLGFLPHAQKMVESFADEDRIAVFSFDSHLKFRLDFTSDKEAVNEAIAAALRTDIPPPPPIVPNPALASRMDRDAMRDAANSETALVLIGNALRQIEGPKTLLLLGWGLGERRGDRVSMRPQWAAARHALDAARTSIFALDTTVADYHDLEMGLIKAAQDTGGFYAKTHLFPELAVERLQRTLSGHYELELRRPDGLLPGTHAVTVAVKKRSALIMAPSSYMDRR